MLNRNEKGQFVKKTNTCDEIAELEARLADLKQQAAAEEKAKKEAETLARKEEANIVNDAIDAYEEAKVICNEKIKAAKEVYQKAVVEAKKELETKEADAEKKLDAFLETHDSFHYTYTSKDGKRTRNYEYRNSAYDLVDNFKLFEDFFKKWF